MSEAVTAKPVPGVPFVTRNPGDSLSRPAALVLMILMMMNIRTFIIDTATITETISSGIYALWLLSIYGLMLYTGNISLYRRIFFVSVALLFFPAFMHDLIIERGFVALSEDNIANTEAPFCHIVIPITLIPAVLSKTVVFPARLSGHYASVYGMLSIWLVASLTLGRGWCSWVCFYGGWDDGFSRVRKKRILNINNVPPGLRYFSFSMLMFTALAALATASSVYCEWLCPFKLVTEFSVINSISSYIATILFILIFFSLVVVLPLITGKRTQCALFCPFGAFQSATNKLNVYNIEIDHTKCRNCRKCVTACPTLSLTKEHIDKASSRPGITCTKCMECINACPHNAISLEFSAPVPEGAKKKVHSLLTALKNRVPALSAFIERSSQVTGDLLRPKALFPFTAFTFGMIISSEFATHTLSIAVSFFTGGA